MKTVLRYVIYAALALLLTSALALWLVLRLALAPGPGEWSTQVKVGPATLDVGVPTALRLLTSTWFTPWMDGARLETPHGPVELGWHEATHTATLRCAPCSFALPALGERPVRLQAVRLSARRDAASLAGTLEADTMPTAQAAAAAPGEAMLQARWTGQLSQSDLRIDFVAQEAPIARWYALLVPDAPELLRARIGGTLALNGQWRLPSGQLQLHPRPRQFQVEGLATEAVLEARSGCGPSARLGDDSWLVRAVLAAEDPRFFSHPGYELAELDIAFDPAQRAGRVDRGQGTLTQQLARRVVAGADGALERRLRELLVAVELEQSLGKPRILQLYLDHAPWGAGVCGAEAAARRYFRRSARSLEPVQAVWLAAMLARPDAELARWRHEGRVDPGRVRRVAEQLRGLNRAQRETLLQRVEQTTFPAPG